MWWPFGTEVALADEWPVVPVEIGAGVIYCWVMGRLARWRESRPEGGGRVVPMPTRRLGAERQHREAA